MGAQHWFFWDGDCGFCRRCAAYCQRRDTRGRFALVPYQEAPSPPMTPRLSAQCEHAIHIVTTDGRVLRAGRAVIFFLSQTGCGPLIHILEAPPFIWVVEAAYKMVAENRMFFSRFFMRDE